MKETQCKNQAELDAALKAGEYPTLIGNAFFDVHGSATVSAHDSATVRAYDSATVRASGSATVSASGSATVSASGSATVSASGSATVSASRFVAVSKQIGHTEKIVGGKVIKIIAPKTALQWLSFYGVEVKNGVAVLFKGVSVDFKSNHNGFEYKPGTTPIAPDWDGGEKECGGGLRFSPRPFMALQFYPEAKRFIACPVRVKDMRAPKPDDDYPNKIKSKGCCAPVWEVD